MRRSGRTTTLLSANRGERWRVGGFSAPGPFWAALGGQEHTEGDGSLKIAVTGATGRLGRPLVDVLRAEGDEVVPISRSQGVDLVTGEGLAEALSGVECVFASANLSSADEHAVTDFFTRSARNLQSMGERAGVPLIVLVSIVGVDRSAGGYYAAKRRQEQELAAGAVPVRILRATQFHEYLSEIVEWGRQDSVVSVPRMRTQPVAVRSVAEALAGLAGAPAPEPGTTPISEIGGPREERLAELAKLLLARRGDPARVEEVSSPGDPQHELFENGALLPGPAATLAGPTFEEWLDGGGPETARGNYA